MHSKFFWTLSAICSATVTFAQPAAAATALFDFVSVADGGAIYVTDGISDAGPYTLTNGFEGNWNFPDELDPGIPAVVGDGAGIVDLDSGIIVRAQGLSSTGNPADAFLDASSFGGKPAGLGVCSSTSCKTGVAGASTGDDNLNRATESLVFEFNLPVRVARLTINDALHNPADGEFTIGGISYTVVNGVVDPVLLSLLPLSTTFTLNYVPEGPELYIGDFRVTTIPNVPLPASAALLAGAIGLLGWRARRV